VNHVWFSHDGNRLASSSWDNTYRLWNVWTGRQLLIAPAGNAHWFSRDDSRTAMGTMQLTEVCQATGRSEWREFCPRTDPSSAWQCAWSPDGRILASGDRGGLRLWIVASGQEVRLPLNEDVECWGVAFDPTGAFLVAGTGAGLRCWTLTKEQLHDGDRLLVGGEERFGPTCSTGHVFINEAGTLLATSCGDAMQVYEWPSRRRHWSLRLGPDASGVWGGVMSPSGRLSLGWPYRADQRRGVWDLATGAVLRDLPSLSIYGGAFARDDGLLVAGSLEEYVAWDTRYWSNLWKMPRENAGDSHARVALTRDGTLGALTLSAQTIRLFDPWTAREFAVLEAPEPENIDWLAFSPDDVLLAATTRSGATHLWDLRLIRQELAAMNLDWDAPPLPPAQTNSTLPISLHFTSGSQE
jgi:WD40 repeat protein